MILKEKQFKNKNILISAGPTYENIDPVRFIGNYSTGLMGFSIAKELANRGAYVKLISGPVHLKINHPNIDRIDVISSEDMHNACIKNFSNSDITIMTAAVADYTLEKTEKQKIKKHKSNITLILKPTKDILAELGKNKKKNQILIGFALETNNEIENAKTKLENKNLDFIVLNSLKDKNAGPKHKTNKITIIDKYGNINHYDLKLKTEVAKDIADKIAEIL